MSGGAHVLPARALKAHAARPAAAGAQWNAHRHATRGGEMAAANLLAIPEPFMFNHASRWIRVPFDLETPRFGQRHVRGDYANPRYRVHGRR